MRDGRDLFKDFRHARLFKPISADALTGHPRFNGKKRVVLADPTQAETNGTFRVGS